MGAACSTRRRANPRTRRFDAPISDRGSSGPGARRLRRVRHGRVASRSDACVRNADRACRAGGRRRRPAARHEMYHVVDQIGARALWEQGFTGSGVNVAVIDTGIAPVESLGGEGKVVAAVDFSADAANPAAAFTDAHGHGTFVSGIIAGREPGSDPALAAQHPEWFLGVAPDAGIVSVKVDDAQAGVDQADVISGIDWVVQNAESLDIGVINLSYSSGSLDSYENDALAAAVERAWNAGIVVVAAGGNDGVTAEGLASPANDPFVIAVAGAKVSDDGIVIADWSSSGDGVRNPDIAAPGAHLNSLRAPGSDADVNHPEGFVDDETFRGSGTSHAAGVIAGVVALLRDAHPDWSPDQIKAALVDTAEPIAGFSAVVAGNRVRERNRCRRRRRDRCDPGIRPVHRRVHRHAQRRRLHGLDGELVDRELVDRELVDRELVDRELVDRELVDRELVDRELVDRELVDRELVDRELVDLY